MPNLVHGQDTGEGIRPIKVGLSRQSNPTAIVHGNPVNPSYDDLGRQVTWPYQVRDLIATAFATLTRGTETAVMAATASTLTDVITITGANTSDAAIRVDFRSGTGGTVLDSVVIPATNVISKTYHVPLLASETAQIWTAQSITTDQSDSPVSITMIGIKNV